MCGQVTSKPLCTVMMWEVIGSTKITSMTISYHVMPLVQSRRGSLTKCSRSGLAKEKAARSRASGSPSSQNTKCTFCRVKGGTSNPLLGCTINMEALFVEGQPGSPVTIVSIDCILNVLGKQRTRVKFREVEARLNC